MTPDLSKFGQSINLHASLYAIREYVSANKRYPTAADGKWCLDKANEMAKSYGVDVELTETLMNRAI